ncbi:MAG TPA: CBS domain-containing protein [Mycobacterium sp.]|nr:CBS domain-containing protein [Mycobacterium sp.]
MTGIPTAGSIVVADLIGDAVVRIPAAASVAEAAKAIVDKGVGVLVVGDEARPTAVLSERDVVRVVAAGDDPAAVRAADIATTKLVWCEAEDSVAKAATRMTDRYIRHILVERAGALAGIVSARDLLGVYAGDTADSDLQG